MEALDQKEKEITIMEKTEQDQLASDEDYCSVIKQPAVVEDDKVENKHLRRNHRIPDNYNPKIRKHYSQKNTTSTGVVRVNKYKMFKSAKGFLKDAKTPRCQDAYESML